MKLSNTTAFGLVAAVVTVLIWAGFMLVTRFAVQSNFTVEEILVLRFLPAFLVVSPFMFKIGILPRGQSWLQSLILMFGASAISPYLISSGLAHAPASDGGALAPGMLPFWTALAAYFIIGEKPGLSRMIGLAVILIGAILVGFLQVLTAVGDDVWKGHLLFLGGSGVWAVHSVIFKQSGISPIHVLVIGIFWGTLFTTPLLFLTGNVSFQLVEIDDLLIMMVLQSFVMGILAMLLFTYAVRALGAAQTAAFGALIPILALLGGVVFLGEEVTALKLVGVALVAFGVFLASGMISKFRSMPSA